MSTVHCAKASEPTLTRHDLALRLTGICRSVALHFGELLRKKLNNPALCFRGQEKEPKKTGARRICKAQPRVASIYQD